MPPAPHPLVLRGREALQRGDMRAVEAAADERLKTAGRDVNALELRFIVQQRRGQFGQAARTLDTVIGIDPRADWAYNELVQLFMTHGKPEEAEKVARAALRVNPRNAQAHNLFGTILSGKNDRHSGEWHLRRALELDPSLAAAESAPTEDIVLRANDLSRLGRYTQALALLEAAETLTGEAHLARGRVHDRLGNYAAAWNDFQIGKAKLLKEKSGIEYRADAVASLFERCKLFVTRANMELLPCAGLRPDTAQPVFVMGFPRSGTRLVEQILGSHPSIAAGGELPFVADTSKLASCVFPGSERFPESLANSWMADYHYVATLFRDYYLARAEQYGLLEKVGGYFTDTMPFNEIYLPLIRMAFPKAKIVRVVRHPLDVCISMFSNNITHDFHCDYRIEDISNHLAAVFDLVEHYGRQLDLNEHVLRYETLVGDQAGETRRLLDYLGVPAHEHGVPKLDDRSIGRHRNYAQQLKPYVARLQRSMTAYGYE